METRARDRAAIAATTILQIINTVPADDLRQQLEEYLRDELVNLEHQITAERELP